MNQEMSNADFFVPDGVDPTTAMERTSHLGIGAHQDDLEFMALHGILECYDNPDNWFGGIICTDGAGSARSGPFKDYTNDQMIEVRAGEQRKAARIGQYGFVTQLAYPSSFKNNRSSRQSLVEELAAIIQSAGPEILYTHNPFDRHPTHIGVLLAVLEAIRSLPEKDRPEKLIGCEVWRSLDWLPDSVKLVQPLDSHPGLAGRLNAAFASQIAGGKRYDLAVEGRWLANATFTESHAIDAHQRVACAVDLTSLVKSTNQSVESFASDILKSFSAEVQQLLKQPT